MIIKTSKTKKQHGLTLIESLVVVGILLGIIAIALTLYGTVRDRLNVKNESENISFIFSQVTDLFSDEQTDDLDNQLAVEAGIIPKKMKTTGNTVYNSWDGKVEIEGTGNNGFTLEYDRVPVGAVCVDLVRNQRQVGWDSVQVGSSNEITYSGLKISSLATACNSGTTDYMVITFEKSE